MTTETDRKDWTIVCRSENTRASLDWQLTRCGWKVMPHNPRREDGNHLKVFVRDMPEVKLRRFVHDTLGATYYETY